MDAVLSVAIQEGVGVAGMVVFFMADGQVAGLAFFAVGVADGIVPGVGELV